MKGDMYGYSKSLPGQRLQLLYPYNPSLPLASHSSLPAGYSKMSCRLLRVEAESGIDGQHVIRFASA